MIWMRGSRAARWTGTVVGAPPTVAWSPARSMVALKSWLLSWLATSGGAYRRMKVTAPGSSRRNAPTGWFSGWMGTWPGHVWAFWEMTSPA